MITIIRFVYKQTLILKDEVEVPNLRMDVDGEIYTIQSYFDAVCRDIVPLKDFDCKIQW
jgi:hypothetical protein